MIRIDMVEGFGARPRKCHRAFRSAAPIAGTVSEITYHPAPNVSMNDMFVRDLLRLENRYAGSPHVWANERNAVRIDGVEHSAFVVQIADQQVNRIDCHTAEGDSIE